MPNPEIDLVNSKIWRNSKGELHRLDGPAIEKKGGYKAWYVDDIKVTEEDYPVAVLLYKCKMVLES